MAAVSRDEALEDVLQRIEDGDTTTTTATIEECVFLCTNLRFFYLQQSGRGSNCSHTRHSYVSTPHPTHTPDSLATHSPLAEEEGYGGMSKEDEVLQALLSRLEASDPSLTSRE